MQFTAHADEGQILVTTIPAEKGWSAYVDGEQAETKTWLNAFLSLNLSAGEYTVELRYTTPGLLSGVALGGASVLILVLAVVWRKRKRKAGTIAINTSEEMS